MGNDEVSRYNKEDIANSNKYKHSCDLVRALLDNDKTYTLEEVDKILKEYRESEDK